MADSHNREVTVGEVVGCTGPFERMGRGFLLWRDFERPKGFNELVVSLFRDFDGIHKNFGLGYFVGGWHGRCRAWQRGWNLAGTSLLGIIKGRYAIIIVKCSE